MELVTFFLKKQLESSWVFFQLSYLPALGKLLPPSTSLAVPFAFFIFYDVEEVEMQKNQNLLQ